MTFVCVTIRLTLLIDFESLADYVSLRLLIRSQLRKSLLRRSDGSLKITIFGISRSGSIQYPRIGVVRRLVQSLSKLDSYSTVAQLINRRSRPQPGEWHISINWSAVSSSLVTYDTW